MAIYLLKLPWKVQSLQTELAAVPSPLLLLLFPSHIYLGHAGFHFNDWKGNRVLARLDKSFEEKKNVSHNTELEKKKKKSIMQ